MPRKIKYERTTNRQSWSEESMAGAIREVLSGSMGYKKASASFNVPQSTLEDRVRKARQNALSPESAAGKGLGRYKPIFSVAQEKELLAYILTLEERLFGITLTDLRELAFELAEKNNISHTFNKEKKMAGKEWLYSFLSRNPDLSLRDPEKTSLARAKGFNRNAVQKFFTLLQSLYEKHKISPCDIYNVDETGILTVPNKPSKVLALRGKKQVGCLSSAERGVLVTVETCMNAAGIFMPPMFVFPRAKSNPLLMDDAPPGSFAVYNKSGWITKETFLVWFKRFVNFSHPSVEKPVLLILDGHSTHTKSIELINAARKEHVILLCFPPHTTHRLQPLDVSVMAPLSAYYEQEVRKWLISHPGRAVTIYQIGKLFRAAYLRTAVAQTAIKGFEKTGIYPFNNDVFPDHLFAPSDTTERPMENVDNPLPKQPQVDTSTSKNPLAEQPQVVASISDNHLPEQPQVMVPSTTAMSPQTNEGQQLPTFGKRNVVKQSTPRSGATPLLHKMTDVGLQVRVDDQQPSTSSQAVGQAIVSNFSISPREIMPLPVQQGPRAVKKFDKRRGKTVILTSSPYKLELELEEQGKAKKQENKNVKRKLFKDPKKKM